MRLVLICFQCTIDCWVVLLWLWCWHWFLYFVCSIFCLVSIPARCFYFVPVYVLYGRLVALTSFSFWFRRSDSIFILVYVSVQPVGLLLYLIYHFDSGAVLLSLFVWSHVGSLSHTVGCRVGSSVLFACVPIRVATRVVYSYLCLVAVGAKRL